MKVIKPNDIEIEQTNKIGNQLGSLREAIKNMIRIEDNYIQYVNAEKEGNVFLADMHPFVEAAYTAYSYHYPLVITPDIIWYLISSAVATHINLNAEKLRSKFVNHEGKKEINIRRDDFVLNSLNNPWHEVIDEFTEQIGQLTNNDIASKLVADFSTTTKVGRVVSQIVLMDAMQKYFEYGLCTMCGIPEIRVTGTKQDWENIRNKKNHIAKLMPDLFEAWDKSLDEILQNFVDVFDDKIDNQFWNDIFKAGGASGGPYISGWIVGLFPYLSKDQPNPFVTKNQTWRNIVSKRGSFGAGLKTYNFDYHMNQVPFTWNYFNQKMDMLFVGGLVGIQFASDKSLTPVFGYAITEKKTQHETPTF